MTRLKPEISKRRGPIRFCPNCKRPIKDGHFVPPSMGESGFFACEAFDNDYEPRAPEQGGKR